MTADKRQIPYPRFAWSHYTTLFTILGTLIGVTITSFPGIVDLRIRYRCTIVAGLFALPAFLVAMYYIVRIIMAFVHRALHFKVLIRKINGLEEELTDTISAFEEKLLSTQSVVDKLIRERAGKNSYTIDYCYKSGSRTLIALRRKSGPPLSNGQKIAVIDDQNGTVMGHFCISKQEKEHYLCEHEKGYMDAVWLGYIEHAGAQHSKAPLEALAIAISDKRGDENE